MCVCVCVCVCVRTRVLSHVQLFAILWTVACWAPLSRGFPRQEYWSSLPFPPLGDLPDSGIKPMSPTLAGRFFTNEPSGKSLKVLIYHQLSWTLTSGVLYICLINICPNIDTSLPALKNRDQKTKPKKKKKEKVMIKDLMHRSPNNLHRYSALKKGECNTPLLVWDPHGNFFQRAQRSPGTRRKKRRTLKSGNLTNPTSGSSW